jgi:hypothetical protein
MNATGIIIGVDPGGGIGLAAIWSHNGELVRSLTMTDPVAAFGWIISYRDAYRRANRLRVTIEDFQGGGQRSKDVIQTIQQVGWFRYACVFSNIESRVVGSQVRMAYRKPAALLLGFPDILAHEHPQGHEQEALAHALAYREKVK